MAQRIVVQLVDDIDASEATETIQFALDGVGYEIDLSDENATRLRESIGTWTTAGRRVSGRTAKSSPRPQRTGDATAIREWAKANGKTFSARGRISAELRREYDAAH